MIADQCFGLSEPALTAVLRDAAVILNLHGGTVPRPEHCAGGRLVYVGTDPVEVEVSLDNGDQGIDRLPGAPLRVLHVGRELRQPRLPGALFRSVRVRADAAADRHGSLDAVSRGAAEAFTTVGNWRQPYRSVAFRGEIYHWSKHLEFLKFIDLPCHGDQPFELALVNALDEDRQLLEAHGWRVRDASALNQDLDAYRQYIGESRGEFTVAKDQNVRLRSGWFSDRSASYLACGRPVITQETGFSNVLPTGEGLFAFSTMEEIRRGGRAHQRRLHAPFAGGSCPRPRVVRLPRRAGRDARSPRRPTREAIGW